MNLLTKAVVVLVVVPIVHVACGGGGGSDGRDIELADGLASDVSEIPDRARAGDLDGREPVEPPVTIDDEGFFRVRGVRTRILGVEFYPLETEILEASIPVLRDMGCNFVFFYGHFEHRRDEGQYEMLADEGFLVAQMVAMAKMGDGGGDFPMTGGGVGTLPDEAFIQDQLAYIADVVGPMSAYEHVLFWLIGGEFVAEEFVADGGTALRDVVRRLTDQIRAHDPLGRPVTAAHHILEAALFPDRMVDFTDIVDFSWFTIATHLHAGDMERDPPDPWAPAVAMEDPTLLGNLVQTAFEYNHERPIYLASWYPNAVQPVCVPSYDATMAKWQTITEAAPFVGAGFWPFIHWLDGSPHTLAVVDDTGPESILVTNESYDAARDAYLQTGWEM